VASGYRAQLRFEGLPHDLGFQLDFDGPRIELGTQRRAVISTWAKGDGDDLEGCEDAPFEIREGSRLVGRGIGIAHPLEHDGVRLVDAVPRSVNVPDGPPWMPDTRGVVVDVTPGSEWVHVELFSAGETVDLTDAPRASLAIDEPDIDARRRSWSQAH
jgi:hypothetical protein